MPGNIRIQGHEVFLTIDRETYHFNTKDVIGAGAMGTVYRGRNIRDSHDMVAVKHLNPSLANIPSVRDRARLEASLAFRHRNLVEMIGCCEDNKPGGHLFMVSRLVQGTTIDEYVKKFFKNKPDRVTRIIKLLLPVLEALEFLHNKNIIHLDIKPSNLMVENGSNIRLMDLGIAYLQNMPGITAAGLLGTPGYAAPEQYLENGVRTMDFQPSTDIYQVGATLYELIGGKKPYENNEIKLKPLPGVSNRLMKVLEKSLEKDLDSRFQTTSDFAKALKAEMANKKTLWERMFK